MIMTGMIYRYSEDEAKGTLMLSDGEIQEFTNSQWIDTNNTPTIGQKIKYTINGNKIEIESASDEEFEKIKQETQNKENTQNEPKQEQSNEQQFSTVEEYIEYFENSQYKVIKDTQNGNIRSVTMRFYDNGEFGEAFITQTDSKIELKQTKNGRPV